MNKIPCIQSGVSNPSGVLMNSTTLFSGIDEEKIITTDVTQTPSNAIVENSTIKAPKTFAKAPNIFISASPIPLPTRSAPFFT